MSFFSCGLAKGEDQPPDADTPDQAVPAAAPANSATAPSDPWHAGFTGYIWFPGVHGVTGNLNHEVPFRASAGDLLSHFRFGLMGTLEAQRGRFVLLTDLMWVRLQANHQKALPYPGLPELSAQVKAWEFIITPEFGYRFVDGEKIKVDALGGLRYWHVGSSLHFTPSLLGLNFSGSLDFADPLMGARIQFPLSPKLLVTIMGDAGGWGAGAQLDYDIVGAIGYKLNPKFTMGVGYRYLYVDYHPGNFLYQVAMSGPGVYLTYNFK